MMGNSLPYTELIQALDSSTYWRDLSDSAQCTDSSPLLFLPYSFFRSPLECLLTCGESVWAKGPESLKVAVSPMTADLRCRWIPPRGGGCTAGLQARHIYSLPPKLEKWLIWGALREVWALPSLRMYFVIEISNKCGLESSLSHNFIILNLGSLGEGLHWILPFLSSVV